MKDEQMAALVSLIAGLEMAVIHICHVLDQKGLVSQVELVKSLEATADGLSPNVINREIVAKPLRDIADGLRKAGLGGPGSDLLNRLRS